MGLDTPPILRGGGAAPHPNFWDPLLSPKRFDLQQPNSIRQHILERGMFLWSDTPHPKGPSAPPPFLETPYYNPYTV